MSSVRVHAAFLAILAPLASCEGCGTEGQDSEDLAYLDTGLLDDVALLDPWIQPDVWVEPEGNVSVTRVQVRYQGELADRDALTLYHGFDGGRALEELEGWLGGVDGSYCPDYYLERAMESDEEGGWRVEFDVPEGVEVLDLWFEDPADGTVDDALGLRYHHAFGFPYAGPWLTWDASARPGNGVVVNWQTDIPCLGVVAYAADGQETALAAGTHRRFRHHVQLTDLTPDTRYQYRVFDCAGQSSERFSFTTMADDPTEIELVVLADMQDDADPDEGWDEVAQAVLDVASGVDLLLVPGDMPCNDTPGSWWRFFDRGGELLATYPMVPALGNHDTPTKGHHQDSSSFEQLFSLPDGSGSEAYYRMDLGPLIVLVLNSEVRPSLVGPKASQRLWLEAQIDELEGHDGWVFVAMHEPIYNLGRRFYDVQEDYRPVSALFDGTVDWVFTGHEHIYQRMHPLRFDAQFAPSGRYGRGDDDGVGYVVVPTAGDQTFEGKILSPMAPTAEDRDWMAYPEPVEDSDVVPAEIGFVVVRLAGEDFELEAWGQGTLALQLPPHVVDELSYTRR